MALSLDPTLVLAARLGLALLFAVAVAHKLRDPAAFRAAFDGYRLMPEPLLAASVWTLIAFELATVAALLLSPFGGLAAAALLGLYSAAIGANLARGRREIDCGCFGPAARQPLSAGLVVRNLALIALALACATEPAVRALVWLDAFTVAFAVALGALAYASVNALLANAPRLRALRDA